MKKFTLSIACFIGLAISFASAQTTEVLQGNISANKTLTADKVWVLKGYVYVTAGATLTVEPGTLVQSDISEKGALIIERGSKIMADGTLAKPIVFTSGRKAGERQPGDWGGIIVLGAATTNRTTEPTIEGGVGRPYGGTNDADNSGVIRYVRIEFAGIAASPGSEINALTLGAVGSGTTIEYVETIYANDDAFEFFGGTVNCKYLIAYGTADDDFDFDFGYRGKIQYAFSLRDPSFVDSGDAGNGLEADNDGTGTSANPHTRPVLSNFTFVGPNVASGEVANHNLSNRWRRSVFFALRNSILMGHPDGGFSIESKNTINEYKANDSVEFKNNLVHARTRPYRLDSAAAYNFASNPPVPSVKDSNAKVIARGEAEMKIKAEGQGCQTFAAAADIKLTNTNILTPDLRPAVGSPAIKVGDFTGADFTNTFFTPTTFVGALSPDAITDWSKGWAIYGIDGTTSIRGRNNLNLLQSINIYPNPATAITTVDFAIEKAGNYSINVYDMNGRVVKEVASQSFNAGNNTVAFNATDLTAGNYVIRFVGQDGFYARLVEVVR